MSVKNINKALILLILSFSFLDAKIIQAEQLFNKKLIKVKKESISISKSFYAKTMIDETSVEDIVTRFDGYITKLNANKTYMRVKKGQTLFSIYSDDILSLQNELQIAKNFNKNIYKSTLVKLKSLDISNSELNKIKRGVINSKGINITSNSNAIILKKNINNKSSVKKGQLLLQLASLDKIWVVASIYQSDLSFVKKGMDAKIKIDGVAKTINSKVDFVYPIFDEKSKTVDVRFIIDNKELNIFPSMFAKVNITKEQKSMLVLPKSAVLKKGNEYFVFKPISKSEFEPIKISATRISSNRYEITSGLKQSDEVINNALFLLDSDALTNALYESDDDDW